jgi:hypothetical protein
MKCESRFFLLGRESVMSTARAPRSQGITTHPTRQQLDELDALLQRMLDLPVNKVADDLLKETKEEPEQSAPPVRTPPRPPVTPKTPSSPRTPVTESKPKPVRIAQVSLPEAERAAQSSDTPAQEGNSQPPANTLEPRIVAPVGEENLAQDTSGLARPAGTTSAEAAGSETEDWVPLRSSWKPSPHTWQPLAQTWQQAQVAAERAKEEATDPSEPEADDGPSGASAPEQPVSADAASSSTGAAVVQQRAPESGGEITTAPSIRAFAPGESSPEEDTRATLPSILTPATEEVAPGSWVRWLVSFNHRFDAVLARAGAPGQWLSGPAGRTVLGVLGLGFLAAALGLAAVDWFGWTR